MPYSWLSDRQRKAFHARKKSGESWFWPRKKKSGFSNKGSISLLKNNGRGLLLRDK